MPDPIKECAPRDQSTIEFLNIRGGNLSREETRGFCTVVKKLEQFAVENDTALNDWAKLSPEQRSLLVSKFNSLIKGSPIKGEAQKVLPHVSTYNYDDYPKGQLSPLTMFKTKELWFYTKESKFLAGITLSAPKPTDADKEPYRKIQIPGYTFREKSSFHGENRAVIVDYSKRNGSRIAGLVNKFGEEEDSNIVNSDPEVIKLRTELQHLFRLPEASLLKFSYSKKEIRFFDGATLETVRVDLLGEDKSWLGFLYINQYNTPPKNDDGYQISFDRKDTTAKISASQRR